MLAALKILAGPLPKRILLLPSSEQGPFLIGSSPEANLRLSGSGIEDRHAVLLAEGDGHHRLVPVASKQRTWVDTIPPLAAQILRDGKLSYNDIIP